MPAAKKSFSLIRKLLTMAAIVMALTMLIITFRSSEIQSIHSFQASASLQGVVKLLPTKKILPPLKFNYLHGQSQPMIVPVLAILIWPRDVSLIIEELEKIPFQVQQTILLPMHGLSSLQDSDRQVLKGIDSWHGYEVLDAKEKYWRERKEKRGSFPMSISEAYNSVLRKIEEEEVRRSGRNQSNSFVMFYNYRIPFSREGLFNFAKRVIAVHQQNSEHFGLSLLHHFNTFAISMHVFSKIGPFDENIWPVGGEGIDYYIRTKRCSEEIHIDDFSTTLSFFQLAGGNHSHQQTINMTSSPCQEISCLWPQFPLNHVVRMDGEKYLGVKWGLNVPLNILKYGDIPIQELFTESFNGNKRRENVRMIAHKLCVDRAVKMPDRNDLCGPCNSIFYEDQSKPCRAREMALKFNDALKRGESFSSFDDNSSSLPVIPCFGMLLTAADYEFLWETANSFDVPVFKIILVYNSQNTFIYNELRFIARLLQQWGIRENFVLLHEGENIGVAAGWNRIANVAFHNPKIHWAWITNADLIVQPPGMAGFTKEAHRIQREGSIGLFHFMSFGSFALYRSAYQFLGEFDEVIFPAYAEDVEYSIRCAVAGVGRSNWPNPSFKHVGSVSAKNDKDFNQQMKRWGRDEYIFRKWGFDIRTFNFHDEPGVYYWKHPWNSPLIPLNVSSMIDPVHRQCIKTGDGADGNAPIFYHETPHCYYNPEKTVLRRFPEANVVQEPTEYNTYFSSRRQYQPILDQKVTHVRENWKPKFSVLATLIRHNDEASEFKRFFMHLDFGVENMVIGMFHNNIASHLQSFYNKMGGAAHHRYVILHLDDTGSGVAELYNQIIFRAERLNLHYQYIWFVTPSVMLSPGAGLAFLKAVQERTEERQRVNSTNETAVLIMHPTASFVIFRPAIGKLGYFDSAIRTPPFQLLEYILRAKSANFSVEEFHFINNHVDGGELKYNAINWIGEYGPNQHQRNGIPEYLYRKWGIVEHFRDNLDHIALATPKFVFPFNVSGLSRSWVHPDHTFEDCVRRGNRKHLLNCGVCYYDIAACIRSFVDNKGDQKKLLINSTLLNSKECLLSP